MTGREARHELTNRENSGIGAAGRAGNPALFLEKRTFDGWVFSGQPHIMETKQERSGSAVEGFFGIPPDRDIVQFRHEIVTLRSETSRSASRSRVL